MNSINITIGTQIKFNGFIEIYEVYSIRKDGKFYCFNIEKHEDQVTGYLDRLENISLVE